MLRKGKVLHRNWKGSLLALACLILLLGGCGSTPAAEPLKEYEYTTEEIWYSEEQAQYSFRADMEHTEAEYADYFFQPSVEREERSACIRATEQILSALEGIERKPEIYVFSEDNYDSRYITEGKLFQTVRAWQSADYAADVLLTAYGEFSHYGLAYGYGTLLCGEGTEQKIEPFLSKPSDVLDLNRLCFDEAFVSEEERAMVRAVACDFAASYVSEHGETMLQKLLSTSDTEIGMEVVRDALVNYYSANGVEYTPSEVRYGYGGVSFDYIVFSELGTFYLSKDWSDANEEANPLVSEGFLHQNYTDTKRFYETNLRQMAQYRELFALNHDTGDLSILFLHSRSLPQTSFYQSATNRIYVQNVDSLMHEYIHALTQPRTSMELWETEGFARYFSYRYDAYGIAFLNQDYNNLVDSAAADYVREYQSRIGRPIDMAVDYEKLENIAVWSRSYTDPNASYVAGSSFVQYLVKRFGERAVIDFVYGDGVPLPYAYEELVADWSEGIERTCQSYGKYEK